MILADGYNQTITYWAETALDGFGNRTFDAPVIIQGRWEERTDLVIRSEGEDKPSKAVTYLQQDVELGGFLALGDETANADPTTVDLAYVIMMFMITPSINGEDFIRKVMM